MNYSVITKYFGTEIYAKIKREEKTRMNLAVKHLRNAVVSRLGQKFPPASNEGEPPHLRTGQLRNSIASEVDESGDTIPGRVGTNVRYAKYLELPDYLNRSFLQSTMNQEAENIKRILAGRKIQ